MALCSYFNVEKPYPNLIGLNKGLVYSWLQRRAPETHKGSFGKLQIFAGSNAFAGAAVLCCLGAFKTGAGYVYLDSEVGALSLKSLPELILGHNTEARVLLIGPGLSDLTSVQVKLASHFKASQKLRVVLDATALDEKFLNLFSKMSDLEIVATPHPGEAARLLNKSTEEVQRDRLCSLYLLSEKFPFVKVWVLKGAHTLVYGENMCFENTTGSEAMASAGQGDVLSGIIAALAMEMGSLLEAVATAVFLHGMASDILSQNRQFDRGILAHEVAEAIPATISKILKNS